jgi:hypothetical protein
MGHDNGAGNALQAPNWSRLPSLPDYMICFDLNICLTIPVHIGFKGTHCFLCIFGRRRAYGFGLRASLVPDLTYFVIAGAECFTFIGANTPDSMSPPNFNGPEQIAMVVRELASAIGCQ